MKLSSLFLGTVALVALLPATSHAALVTITNTVVTPGSYEIDGLLSPDAAATFEFGIAGANPSSSGYIGYAASMSPSPAVNTPYILGTAFVQGAFGSAPSTQQALTFSYPNGASTLNPTELSTAVIIASAFMVNPTHEDITFTNNSPLTAGFQALVNFDRFTQIGSGELLSASPLSAVPLPASLPLFLTAFLGLVGFSYFRKPRVR